MWTFIKWEWRRQFRQTRFWGSLAALVILGGLFTYGYSAMHGESNIIAFLGRGAANGFFVPILALSLSTTILLPFFVSLFGGEGVSGERQLGTWAGLLAHGADPWRLFLSKWLVGWGYVIVATETLVLSSVFGGFLVFGLHASSLPSGAEASVMEFWRLLGLMTAYAILGQGVVMTLALSVSAMTRNTLSAIMVTMGMLLVMAMLGDLPFLATLRSLFFTSYFARIGDVLLSPPDWHALIGGVLVYLAYMATLIAGILFVQPFRD